MLVLKRLRGEEVIITTEAGTRVRVVVVEVGHGFVRFGIEAPAEITIHRSEIQKLVDEIAAETGK